MTNSRKAPPMPRDVLARGRQLEAALLSAAAQWEAVCIALTRLARLHVLTRFQVPPAMPVRSGKRYLVTDADGNFVSIVSEELAAELGVKWPEGFAADDLTVTPLPLDHPFQGAVPYPLNSETAALLRGPQ